jgi:hypothetical protein
VDERAAFSLELQGQGRQKIYLTVRKLLSMLPGGRLAAWRERANLLFAGDDSIMVADHNTIAAAPYLL